MKPTNYKDSNCTSQSGRCVTYDGPDIEFGSVKLCKGDSVTALVYYMAQEIIALRDLTDIDNYPVQCLSGVATITDFKSLINALITKSCS